MSASVKIILKTGKTLKNGEHPIMVRIIKDRVASYLSIGASCPLKWWDEKSCLPKKNHPNYEELLVLIDKKRSEANKLLLEIKTGEEEVSALDIKEKIKAKPKIAKMTVEDYFDEFVKRMIAANRIGYADAFKFTKNSLMSYRQGKSLRFSEVSTSFLLKYEEYLDSRNLAPNTIFLYLRTFKTLINYAKKDGVVAKEYNPFESIGFAKYRRVKTRKRALPKDIILAIINLDIKQEGKLFDYWNYFKFSYLCWGMNFIDTAYLKWTNIIGDTLVYTRQKTGDEFNILLTPETKAILGYYREDKITDRAGYIFPILKESHKTALSKSNRIKKVRKQYNAALKEIGEMAGVSGKLTTYVARHTFANVLRQSGVSTTIIKDAMGHESEAMTEVYTSQLDASILGNAINGSLL